MWIFFVICLATIVASAPEAYNYNNPSHDHHQHHNHHDHGGYDYTPQRPIVTKDVYIHVPPDDQENQVHHQSINLGPPRKHYRILFIKAPSGGRTSLSFTPPETEEKTLIYVLSKKNDASDIQTQINTAPTEPSKPEVYFIKYRTQEEAALAQRQIQAQFDALGGTTQVSDEGQAPVTSVVGSLGGVSPRIVGGTFAGSHTHAHTHAAASNSLSVNDNGGGFSASSGYLPPNKIK